VLNIKTSHGNGWGSVWVDDGLSSRSSLPWYVRASAADSVSSFAFRLPIHPSTQFHYPNLLVVGDQFYVRKGMRWSLAGSALCGLVAWADATLLEAECEPQNIQAAAHFNTHISR